jgi:hypothetical protein
VLKTIENAPNLILLNQPDNPTHETVENPNISSLNSNFVFLDAKKLENFYEKIQKCGHECYNLIGFENGHIVQIDLPVYCNNRACVEQGCKSHRGYLYKKEHLPQINKIKENIKVPKSYVFSDKHINIYEMQPHEIRKYIQHRLKTIFKICLILSRTEFSVHLELKLYDPNSKKDGHKYGQAYVHFHVVSGFIDVKKARSMSNFVVKYEYAISRDRIENYISKYASKTPYFHTSYDRDIYFLITYKTQMHRYSVRLKDCTSIERPHLWVMEHILERQLFNILRREEEKPNSFVPYYENLKYKYYEDKPPPKNNEVPACVFVYPGSNVKANKRKINNPRTQTTLNIKQTFWGG